jgi:hypothetical protein
MLLGKLKHFFEVTRDRLRNSLLKKFLFWQLLFNYIFVRRFFTWNFFYDVKFVFRGIRQNLIVLFFPLACLLGEIISKIVITKQIGLQSSCFMLAHCESMNRSVTGKQSSFYKFLRSKDNEFFRLKIQGI